MERVRRGWRALRRWKWCRGNPILWMDELLRVAAIALTLIGLSAIAITLIGMSAISRRRALAYQQYPLPEAILVLDGSEKRIRQAAAFSQQHSALPVWVSGICSQRSAVQKAFSAKPINDLPAKTQPVYFDLRATDTVTHFTTLIDDFTRQNIHHVYLVTSDYHISRAEVSAKLIFGSRGIVFTPVPLPSGGQPMDPKFKSVRDGVRSLLWLTTRQTGARLNPRLRHLPGGVSCLSEVRKN